MKTIKKIIFESIKSEFGLSMTQLLISVAIMSGLGLMSSQLILQSKKTIDQDYKKGSMDSFIDERFRFLTKSDVCNLNLSNQPHTRTLTSIRDAKNIEILGTGKKYLNNIVEITSMQVTKVDDTSIRFEVVWELLPKTTPPRLRRKSVVLPASFDNLNVKYCYQVVDYETIVTDVSDSCSGDGVYIQPDGKCWFKDFPNRNPNEDLAAGWGTYQLYEDPADRLYKRLNRPIFTLPASGCSHKKINAISQTGVVSCLDTSTLINITATTFANGSKCSLKNSNNKLSVSCATGAPACKADGFGCNSIEDCNTCCSGFPRVYEGITDENGLESDTADCSHGGLCGGDCRPNLHFGGGG